MAEQYYSRDYPEDHHELFMPRDSDNERKELRFDDSDNTTSILTTASPRRSRSLISSTGRPSEIPSLPPPSSATARGGRSLIQPQRPKSACFVSANITAAEMVSQQVAATSDEDDDDDDDDDDNSNNGQKIRQRSGSSSLGVVGDNRCTLDPNMVDDYCVFTPSDGTPISIVFHEAWLLVHTSKSSPTSPTSQLIINYSPRSGAAAQENNNNNNNNEGLNPDTAIRLYPDPRPSSPNGPGSGSGSRSNSSSSSNNNNNNALSSILSSNLTANCPVVSAKKGSKFSVKFSFYVRSTSVVPEVTTSKSAKAAGASCCMMSGYKFVEKASTLGSITDTVFPIKDLAPAEEPYEITLPERSIVYSPFSKSAFESKLVAPDGQVAFTIRFVLDPKLFHKKQKKKKKKRISKDSRLVQNVITAFN